MSAPLVVKYWDCPEGGCAYGLSRGIDGDEAIWQKPALIGGGYDEGGFIDERCIDGQDAQIIYNFCHNSEKDDVAPVLVEIIGDGGDVLMTVVSV